MLRYTMNPYAAMQEGLRYGNCYTVRVVGQPPLVMFTDPAAIKEIFAADTATLRAGEASAELLGPIVGSDSLLVLDGPRWRRDRQLMQMAFHGERLRQHGSTISDLTNDVVNTWRTGDTIRLHQAMQTITLEVIMRVVFGVENVREMERLRSALLRFLGQMGSASAAFLLFPAFRIDMGRFSPWGRFKRNRAAVDEVLLEEIRSRRRLGTEGRADVLSMLVDAKDEEGQGLSDGELLDQMFTLLNAAHETTAASLAWTFCHVSRDEDVLERLRQELHDTFRSGPVAPARIGELSYLDAVIQESLRLTPVTMAVLRRVNEPVRIGGYEIPPGVNIAAPIYAVHHHPDLWPDPERFDPERFAGNQGVPHTFLPFGGGARRCLGAAFSTFEMKLVLAEVLSRVTMHVAPGYKARPSSRGVAIAPSSGVPVVVESVAPRARTA